jgi:hypothetical protein
VTEQAVPVPLNLYALGRGVAYAAALVLIGACVFAALIPRWRLEDDDDQSLAARATGVMWRTALAASLILVVAHLLRVWGQAHSFLEPDPVTWEAATRSSVPRGGAAGRCSWERRWLPPRGVVRPAGRQ